MHTSISQLQNVTEAKQMHLMMSNEFGTITIWNKKNNQPTKKPPTNKQTTPSPPQIKKETPNKH